MANKCDEPLFTMLKWDWGGTWERCGRSELLCGKVIPCPAAYIEGLSRKVLWIVGGGRPVSRLQAAHGLLGGNPGRWPGLRDVAPSALKSTDCPVANEQNLALALKRNVLVLVQ